MSQFQNLIQSNSIKDSVELTWDRRIDQWDRLESPEIKSCVYGQIIVNRGAKATQ